MLISLVNADFMVLTLCSMLLSIAAAVVFMASVALDKVDAWGNGAGGKASAAISAAAAAAVAAAAVVSWAKGVSSAAAGTWSNGFVSVNADAGSGDDAGANTGSADACKSTDDADGVGNAFRSESAGRLSSLSLSLLSDACMSDSIVILRRLSVTTFANQSIICLATSSPWYSFGFEVLILLM